MANVFFISMKKKNAKKSFIVFGEAHGRPLNTLKLIFGKMFYYLFFSRLYKIHLSLFFKKSHKFAGII